MSKNIIIEELLMKYRSGTISISELKTLLSLLELKEAPEDINNLFHYIWENSPDSTLPAKYGNFENLLDKIGAIKIESSDSKYITKNKNRILQAFIRYAAVVFITIGVSWFSFNQWNKSERRVNFCSVKVAYGSVSEVTLPDGSKVVLNAGSTLRYPNKFEQTRHVYLDGEAFFEVQKDSEHPFIVNTGDLNIKVFGTRFNVKNYVSDPYIETSLVEGSIGVYKRTATGYSKEVMLIPNEQLIYDKKNNNLLKQNVDAELVSIWTNGKYYFENESFVDIAKKLERNFNLKVKITSKELEKIRFTGLFDKSRSINQVLDAMKQYSSFSYKLINDSLVVKKGN